MHAPCIPQIRLNQDWLRDERGLSFATYDELWQWSVDHLADFWQSVWDYFDLHSPSAARSVLADETMPGSRWFEGAQFNYVHQVLRHVEPAHAAGLPAIVARNESGDEIEIGWRDLRSRVAALALHLRAQGLQPGDRVAAYLPNVPETVIAFLATISLGGVWSLCAPDMGTNAVLDRFKQIAPKVLIASDAVRYAGKAIDRTEVVAQLRNALPSVTHVLLLK